MSEDSEQTLAEQPSTVETLSHKRILTEMAAVIVSGAIACLVFISTEFGIGFLIGGVLSLFNYYWLKQSLKKVFDQAVAGEKPQFLATKYFLRYLTFGLILAFVYLTKFVPVVAVLLGLASFAVAIMIEALIRVLAGFFNKKEI